MRTPGRPRQLALALLVVLALPAAAADPLAWGVTTDDPWADTDDQARALAALPQRPALRVVFDVAVGPEEYREPLETLGGVATIMGEMVDSSDALQLDDAAFRTRVDGYLAALWPLVDVWEIGNEVNGGWTGAPARQALRVAYAFDAVTDRGGRTALTLYANFGCLEEGEEDPLTWSERHLAPELRDGLDYVLLSWWPDDCAAPPPDWQAVFDALGLLFPHAALGIGETGAHDAAAAAHQAAWCYAPGIDHARFIGGCFWWEFRTDMVPAGAPLWQVLAAAMANR